MLYVILEREATGRCYLCGIPLYGNRDTVAHFQATEHRLTAAQVMAERHERNRALALFTEPDDPEIEAHMKAVGARMLREGRWEVKPNERAGFA